MFHTLHLDIRPDPLVNLPTEFGIQFYCQKKEPSRANTESGDRPCEIGQCVHSGNGTVHNLNVLKLEEGVHIKLTLAVISDDE
jgi:hypothetical protein